MCYGLGTYNEIDFYPLAGIKDASELKDYNWPRPDWFDDSSLPEIISEIKRERLYNHCWKREYI